MIDWSISCLLVGTCTSVEGRALTVFVVDTVTNQAINAFTELGLPYIKQYYEEWQGTHAKSAEDKEREDDAVHKLNDMSTSSPEEKRLMQKVARELRLPEYSAFGESPRLRFRGGS